MRNLSTGRGGVDPSVPCGEIYGAPGGSYRDFRTWASSTRHARTGQAGELRTAQILDGLARQPGGPTVLHDVRLPIAGVKANVDHVVVAGTKVIAVDSKVWKPTRYWTAFGHTFRYGFRRFGAADKTWVFEMAQDLLLTPAARIGETSMPSPVAAGPSKLVVVWQSSPGRPLSVAWARHRHAKVVAGEQLTRWIPRVPAACAKQVRFVAGLVTVPERHEGPSAGLSEEL